MADKTDSHWERLTVQEWRAAANAAFSEMSSAQLGNIASEILNNEGYVGHAQTVYQLGQFALACQEGRAAEWIVSYRDMIRAAMESDELWKRADAF